MAQLYAVAEASKNETGGGEGVEVGQCSKFPSGEGGGAYVDFLYIFFVTIFSKNYSLGQMCKSLSAHILSLMSALDREWTL